MNVYPSLIIIAKHKGFGKKLDERKSERSRGGVGGGGKVPAVAVGKRFCDGKAKAGARGGFIDLIKAVEDVGEFFFRDGGAIVL